ncbi:MAG: hypothetical protein JXL97_13270 [Bacteroidales bacterium]|nr:hypothetical protein [Bacteroidales bacterium]
MKNLFKFSFLLVFLTLLFIGCQPTTQPDQATGNDARHADLAVSDVFAFSTGETGGGKLFIDTACYTVETVINADTSRTTTITFDETCALDDGIIRGGQIIINWELGWIWDSTKVTTVTFNNFSRDGDVLAGELELRFLKGSIAQGTKPTHEIVEKGMSLILANEQGTTTWEGTRTIEWQSGILTLADKTDDVKLVDIYKDGINRNGEHYIAEGNSIRLDQTCGEGAKLTSGTLTITKDDGTETLVDFGDGECDDIFSVTQNGVTIEINP